ncbi:peptidase M15, partial [Bacillus sp. TE8-1]
RYLEHSGSWAGYRSYFMRFPKEYLTVVVLSNYDGFDSKKYANEIAGIILEK